MSKPTIWFPNRPDTNLAVQAQKTVRSLKFRIYEEGELYYLWSESNALISFTVTAKLVCSIVFARFADCWFSDEVAHLFILFLFYQLLKRVLLLFPHFAKLLGLVCVSINLIIKYILIVRLSLMRKTIIIS